MRNRFHRHSGFTLIEALIAFVVLTVGILGTLLFHSALLSDSGDNKARLEAIKVAESWIEERRSMGTTSAAYSSGVANLTASSENFPGTNTTYTVSWANSSLASGAVSNVYKVDLTISWPETNQPVQLSTYFGYIDPDNTIRPEDAADGSSGGDYTGKIKVPTGTLKELPRIEIANDAVSLAEAAGDGYFRTQGNQDNIVIYKEGDDSKVALKVDDDTYVQLAQLQNFDNEILTITGRIYLSQDDDHQVSEIFGPVYGVSATDVSATTEDGGVFEKFASDNVEELTDNEFWLNNIIDIRASAGASCVIARYKNDDDDEDEWQRGIYGDYLCVAGTGWNGSIKPYHRQYYFESSTGSFGSRDIEIDGMVCGPPLRSYRYYTLNVPTTDDYTLDDFETAISRVGTVSDVNIEDVLSDAGATVVGQSGLVRFYKDESALLSSDSGEGVLWENFFWHNPNYVISPSQAVGAFELTPTVSAPTPLFSLAEDGYQTPKVTAVTSGYTAANEVNFPGDVAHQNFYIARANAGPRTWDCESVWASFSSGSDFQSISPSIYLDQIVSSSTSSNYEQHGHLVDLGLPGYEGDAAYFPPYSTVSAAVADYNNYNSDLSTGAIILGYTLATESVTGSITFSSDLASLADFSLGGNPEPVISVDCIPDTGTLTEAGSLATYEFECAVPSNWRGYIFAFNNSIPRKISANNPVSVSEISVTTSNIDAVASAARDSSDTSNLGNTAVSYFFSLATGSGGLADGPASSGDFSFLATEYVDTGSGEDIPTISFQFY